MATASPNAEAAAHLNVPQHALEQSVGVIRRGSPRSRSIQFWVPVLAMVSLFGVAALVHKAVADKLQGQAEGWLVDNGFHLSTAGFAGIGLVFLVQAIGAHTWVVRRLNAPATMSTQGTSPLLLVAVPMAIRLATTFAVIAYLLLGATASRNEAVCMVFFWYIALTTMEVAAIVWAQQPTKSLVTPQSNAHE